VRRAAAILAGVLLLAGIAQAQVPPPSADAAWSSVVLVVVGLATLAGMVVAVAMAWRTLTRPWSRIQEDITALRRQVEGLDRIVRAPDAGGKSLLGRLEAVEAVVAEHIADKERREERRDDLTGEVTIALRDVQKYLARLEADGS